MQTGLKITAIKHNSFGAIGTEEPNTFSCHFIVDILWFETELR